MFSENYLKFWIVEKVPECQNIFDLNSIIVLPLFQLLCYSSSRFQEFISPSSIVDFEVNMV